MINCVFFLHFQQQVTTISSSKTIIPSRRSLSLDVGLVFISISLPTNHKNINVLILEIKTEECLTIAAAKYPQSHRVRCSLLSGRKLRKL